MRRILIIHTWGIGDWVFFTPVIRALKESFPKVNIDVILGTPTTKNVVELYPEVHIREVVNVRRGFWGMIKAAIKTWPMKYDVVLFTAGIDSRKADKLAAIIRAKKKVALLTTKKKPRFLNTYTELDKAIHRVENNLKFIKLLGLKPPSSTLPFLKVEGISSCIKGSILIHPGSDKVNSYKRWPTERFASVAKKLLEEGHKVSVILGPSEFEVEGKFSYLKSHKNFSIYKNLPLKEVIKVIASHEIFLNSDSGLGHIASAIGRRTITIFGPADPKVVRPYGKNSVIIRRVPPLPCMPCIRPGGLYGCDKRLCLMDIDVKTVLNTIKKYLT